MDRLATSLLLLATGCIPVAPGDLTPEPLPPPPDQSAQVVLEWSVEDTSRATPEQGDVEASDSRVIDVDVWVPPHAGPGSDERPLVFLLHGLEGHPDTLMGIARHLTDADMVVALPRFPVTASDASGSLGSIVDFPNQPGDVSFVLDWLLVLREDVASPLFRRFHEERIGVIGHSLGGSTTLALTHIGSTLDPRISAAVAVAPASPVLGLYLDTPVLVPTGAPVAISVGNEDTLRGDSDLLFDQLGAPKALVGIPGADHNQPVLGDDEPAPDPRSVTQGLADLWFGEHLLGEPSTLESWMESLDPSYTTRIER